MLASNRVSVKAPITSGDFTMIARGQKHRVSVKVSQEGQCTSLRVTCQKTGKEWWFDALNGKLWRGFDPDKKIPKCELPAVEFQPARSSVPSQLPIPCYPDWIECAGRPYLFPSNEPTDDFIYDDDEPSDLSRYSEPMSDPITWQEF